MAGGGSNQIVVHYSKVAFNGQVYSRQATPRSDRDHLRVLSLLARIRESRFPDAPDDPDEAWELSQMIASLTTAQWEAVEKAPGDTSSSDWRADQ